MTISISGTKLFQPLPCCQDNGCNILPDSQVWVYFCTPLGANVVVDSPCYAERAGRLNSRFYARNTHCTALTYFGLNLASVHTTTSVMESQALVEHFFN